MNHSQHALNALFDRLGHAVSPNSCDIVVLDGHLDVARLRAAITDTTARHPILARPLDPRLGSTAPPPELRVQRLDHDDPPRVDAQLERLIWDEPLAPSQAPLRFVLTETPRRSYLSTLHTHVYADATACYTLTDELARRYSGDTLPPAPSPPTTLRPSAMTTSERLRRAARGLRLTARDLTARDGRLPLTPHAAPGRRRLSRVELTVEQTQQLLAAARERRGSLHALFQLAFARAAGQLQARRGLRPSPLRVWDFFSLRPQLERGGASYDCLALVYPIVLDPTASDAALIARAGDDVRRMRAGALDDHAARFQSLMQLLPGRQLMRAWPRLFGSSVFLTNPGVCPSSLPRFGDVAVRDYVTFPQLFAPADLLLVFSTFRGRLRILSIRDELAFGETFHEELMVPFLTSLDGLGGGGGVVPRASVDGFMAGWSGKPSVERMRKSA